MFIQYMVFFFSQFKHSDLNIWGEVTKLYLWDQRVAFMLCGFSIHMHTWLLYLALLHITESTDQREIQVRMDTRRKVFRVSPLGMMYISKFASNFFQRCFY